MDRLRLWLIPVYALCGLLLVVAVLPKTSWIPRVQVAVLVGTWHGPHGEADDSDPGRLAPQHLLPSLDDPATDDDTLFLKHIRACTEQRGSSELTETERVHRLRGFFDYCVGKNSAEYWAQYVRLDADEARIPEKPAPPRIPTSGERTTINLLAQACESGSKLDPANGFFPAIEAGALYTLGDSSGAERHLAEAGRSSEFDDYAELEPEVEYRWSLARYGYRGNQIKAWEMVSVIYPDISSLSSIARHYARIGKPEDRVAAMRLGGLMVRQSQSLIGLLIGRKIVATALDPAGGTNPLHDKATHAAFAPEQVMELTKSIQTSMPGRDDLPQISRNYLAFRPSVIDPHGADVNEALGSAQLLRGAWALLLLLVLPIGVAATWAKARSPKLSAASPHLIWLLSLGSIWDPGIPARVSPVFSLVAMLAIPALFDRSRRLADAIGIAFAVVAFGAAGFFQFLGLILPATLFLIALFVERRLQKIPTGVTAVVLTFMVAGVAAMCVNSFDIFGIARAATPCLFAAIAAFALIPVRNPVRWQPVLGFACLVVGCTYGYAVYRDLANDRALAAVSQIWRNEANTVRQACGINPNK